MYPSFLLTESCDLHFFLFVHVQNEPAEAAAIQVGAAGHKAPGHTGYPSVQWAQEVFWATSYHPKEQKRSQLQLCGGDVLCLVGKPTERSQGWHRHSAFYGKEAAGVDDRKRDCRGPAMTSGPVYCVGEKGEASCFLTDQSMCKSIPLDGP